MATAEGHRHRRAPDDAGLIGRADRQIGGIALAEPLGHLLAARHVALAQGGGLGPGAEKLAETLDQPGVLVVKHRGEPFRLVMDRGHAFVVQGDLVGDLDREDGNDGQEDEQDKTAKKAHGIFLSPTASHRETLTAETGQPRLVYFVPGYDVSGFLGPKRSLSKWSIHSER